MPDTDLQQTLDTDGCKPPSATSIPQPVAVPMELDLRRYELSESLGRGGMGEVYRCCDPALGRDLAIKVMKPAQRGSPEIEGRFLREARITGSLQHPGIVAIHNLGRLADGRLHYTMRLVRGRTFAAILKEQAGQREPLPNLLNIFEKICQAAAYAHSKHIIHRDLKPHNVMVGRFGEVQVMDWGLAKVLTSDASHDETEEMADAAGTRIPKDAQTPVDLSRTGSGFGTPAYMPPEQALGQWATVDERADVFALGSILCEMLTGQPAYCGTDGMEIYRRAREGDVAEALQRLHHCGVDAALTALCRECLSLRPEDRPRDADAVAKRVASYQAEVQERLRQAERERAQAELREREERKRRRWAIAFVVVLLAGAALTTWQAVRATVFAEAERKAKEDEAAQRQRAEEQKEIAESNEQKAKESAADTKAVLTFFQDRVLSAGRPQDQEGGQGSDVTLRKAVDTAEPEIAKAFSNRPLVEASIRDTMGQTYWYLGKPDLAIPQHERASALRAAKLGSGHPDTLASRSGLASAYWSAGRIAEAIELNEQTLKQMEDKLGPDDPNTVACRNNLATAYQSAGHIAEAIRLLEKNQEHRENKLGSDHSDTLLSRNNLATAYLAAGRAADALRLHKQTLKQREAKLGSDHPDTLTSRHNLAATYLSTNDISEAIRLFQWTLEKRVAKIGSDHPDTLATRSALATAYWSVGRVADAIQMDEQTLQLLANKLGSDHPSTLVCRYNLACAYRSVGRTDDAICLFEPALKQMRAKLGNDHPDTLQAMANLGIVYRDTGRIKDALPLLEEARDRCRKRADGLPAPIAWLPGALAETYERDGQLSKAEVIYRESLAEARRRFGAEAPRTAGPLALLGFYLLRQHKYADAEPLLGQCLKVRAAKQPDDWATFNAHSLLGAALLGQKKYTEAEPHLLQGYQGMKAREATIPPQGLIRLAEALDRLVRLYDATNKKDEAAKWRKRLEEQQSAQKKHQP